MNSFKLLIVVVAISAFSVMSFAQTDTTFSYQGELQEAGAPANGLFNIEFSLYDALSGGSQVGSTVVIVGQSVSDGIFRSQLDFGAQDYSRVQFWLEIEVNGVTLSPRQSITAAPYSIQTRGIFVNYLNEVGIGTSSPQYPLHVQEYGLAAIRAENTFTGTAYGVHATTHGSVFSVGVIGHASASIGINKGGLFYSDSTSGIGVHSVARAKTGTTYGLYSESDSTDGRGVYGEATAITGTTYGVYGLSESTAGLGVYGEATAVSGTTFGVYGLSESSSGRGVYGKAVASSGITDGVFGQSDSTSGRGLCGWAPATSGATYGVFGTSDSTSGRGVSGEARAAIGTTYGGRFEAKSTSGRGVYGEATASSGITYGGRFEAKSTVGRGIFGFASANSGVNYGVVGHSNSSSGYDFWASGAGVDYGSPSSRRFKSNIVPISNPLDKLAKLRGVYFDWDQEHGSAHDVGMIAEEVGKILPEIVNYEENGIDAIGMDYSKLTPLLVEATNALRAEKNAQIEQLKHENKLLNARLDRLERMMAIVIVE